MQRVKLKLYRRRTRERSLMRACAKKTEMMEMELWRCG